MADAARHLHAVDAQTGEVLPGGCPDCAEKNAKIEELTDQVEGLKSRTASLAGQVTKAKNELAGLMAVEPAHDDILDVMVFWRSRLMPGAGITVGSKGWATVRARLRDKDEQTGEQRFTPLALKAAVAAMALDDYIMHKDYRHRRYLENAWSDTGKVDRLIGRAISFKRRTGVSALTLLDELGGTALVWLADRCSCGGVMLEHLECGPGALPCPKRNCEGFDFLNAKVERHLAEAS